MPTLPSQFTIARASASAHLANGSANRAAALRSGLDTPTPSTTPVPSATATLVPSLTPVPSESPTAMFTAIAYANANANSTSVNTPTTCTLTAQTMINLRGDPSVNQMGIGKVFAGSLLQVTGQSADKKWWRVISSDGGVSIEGWVSGDYVKAGTGCAEGAVPVVTAAPSPTRTPTATRTVPPSPTPRPSATPRP